jgi:uncharacterized protein (DUF486 family)
VDIVEKQEVALYDKYMPVVSKRVGHHKFVVVQLEEIQCIVGLVRCSNNENKYKVISQHIQRTSLSNTIGKSNRNL